MPITAASFHHTTARRLWLSMALRSTDGSYTSNIAYADIRAAFMSHARDFPDRPLVLAGFPKGRNWPCACLWNFLTSHRIRTGWVAATSSAGASTPEDVWRFPHLKMAKGEEDTGVIVSFNSESEHISSSLFVPAGGRHTASTH